MTSAAPAEAAALEAALSALLSSTLSGGALARQARALSRAADDAEVAAAECADAASRRALMEQVDAARGAAVEARRQARISALSAHREELMEGAVGDDMPRKDREAGVPAGLAKDINDGLRRATAIVSEEVGRSEAAGRVVDESSRRLRRTRDQHGRYGESLGSGAKTLSELRRTDLIANIAVVLSFAVFFFVAAYVAHRRVSSSNTATFLVRPAAKIVFTPVRIMVRIVAFVLRKPVLNPNVGQAATNRVQADVKGKSRKARENESSTHGNQDASVGEDDGRATEQKGTGSKAKPALHRAPQQPDANAKAATETAAVYQGAGDEDGRCQGSKYAESDSSCGLDLEALVEQKEVV